MTTIHLETERLIIRSPVPEDASRINAAIRASLGDLRPWMPWARQAPTIAQTTENLQQAIASTAADQDFRLLLFLRSGELVGSSGIHQIDWRIPRGEVGYWADSAHAGRGLISEAVTAIIDHAHRVMGLRRIEVIVSDRNRRSWRIPERIGLTLEGVLRCHRVNQDGARDHTRIYASIREEVAPHPHWRQLHEEACAKDRAGG
jgi:RimJ/RimL family protein N-acetyltransferase